MFLNLNLKVNFVNDFLYNQCNIYYLFIGSMFYLRDYTNPELS